MSTLHILSSPTNPVNLKNRTDPFAIAVYKMISFMQGHNWNCVHYSILGADVPCETELCLPYIYEDADKCRTEYNIAAAKLINSRKKSEDLVLCFHGIGNKLATEQNNDLPIIEPNIGYDHTAVFAPYRAFTSYAVMHMFYGHNRMLMNPSWFDAVIPNSFTPSEFEFKKEKENYILYFGRIISTKGIHLAIQSTEISGDNLILAGPGSIEELGYSQLPKHVSYVGVCDVEQRRKLMSNAKAIIGPTYYVEPFGNMIVEGYFSGTPAITTDWGGFTETVVNGVTGFRCREMKEFVYALENIEQIDPQVCYNYAMNNYTDEIIYKKYHEYFSKIQTKDFYRK